MQMNKQVGGTLGGGASRNHRVMSEINITPFVDVMLVLLVIFMVTAPLLTAGVQVDLPEEDTKPLPGQDEPLSISVDRQGRIFIQETQVELDELVPKLQAITKRNKDARIFVRGDQSIEYGNVMAVMATITQAGFTKIGLVTTQPNP